MQSEKVESRAKMCRHAGADSTDDARPRSRQTVAELYPGLHDRSEMHRMPEVPQLPLLPRMRDLPRSCAGTRRGQNHRRASVVTDDEVVESEGDSTVVVDMSD
jgi:hypothetical protein